MAAMFQVAVRSSRRGAEGTISTAGDSPSVIRGRAPRTAQHPEQRRPEQPRFCVRAGSARRARPLQTWQGQAHGAIGSAAACRCPRSARTVDGRITTPGTIYIYVTPEELSAPDSYSGSPSSYSGAEIVTPEELSGYRPPIATRGPRLATRGRKLPRGSLGFRGALWGFLRALCGWKIPNE
eukprot:scaffold24744_cov103-Isochrysis_galbana.AAC.2